MSLEVLDEDKNLVIYSSVCRLHIRHELMTFFQLLKTPKKIDKNRCFFTSR